MQETLLVVEDLETLERVKEYLANPDFNYVAVDTETTGLDKDAEVVGYSISCEESIGIYVVLSYWESLVTESKCEACPPQLLTKAGKPKKKKKCTTCEDTGVAKFSSGKMVYNKEIKEASRDIMNTLLTKSLIMHNAPFDCDMIKREFGIELMGSLHTDTMELAHVLDENESCGLKEVGSRLFGEDSVKEKEEMKASVIANGGDWTAKSKEMFKADKEILGRYGAKDTILTYKIFQALVPQLFEEGLDKFFYEEESMPLMRGPTYELNTVGLRVDLEKLKQIEKDLTEECARLKHEIIEEITPKVKERYPATNAKNTFNIGSSQQMAWLMFVRLGNEFKKLTDGGRVLAKELVEKVPYNAAAKRAFIHAIQNKRKELERQLETCTDENTQKFLQKKINKLVPEKYMKCDKDSLFVYAKKYTWVAKLLKYSASMKLLKTYVKGIKSRTRYGIIYPSFLQAGTTSGRYSSRNPNFQNLPRDDKRIKSCITARPGRVFVGADQSQLEPRVFASVSQDKTLMDCFKKGEDFYSVVGIPIFKDYQYSAFKKHEMSWAKHFENKRNITKAFALATPYGTTAYQQADKLRDEEGNNLTPQQCQEIIDFYFESYPSVYKMMIDSHNMARRDGKVYSLYGRPRRMPEALRISAIYGPDATHEDLPYEARTPLNLAMNHRVQSSAATIMNRAAIAFYNKIQELQLDAKIVMQVHDELIIECKEDIAEQVAQILKDCMENTTTLPGVVLLAEPKIATNLADLK